jgi:hypothetical protein
VQQDPLTFGRLADAALVHPTPLRVGKITSTKLISQSSSNICRGSSPSPPCRPAASVFHNIGQKTHQDVCAHAMLSVMPYLFLANCYFVGHKMNLRGSPNKELRM